MLYSKVFLRLHWGYSIRRPSVKERSAFLLPPPTTLIGALSYYKFRGIDTDIANTSTASATYKLKNIKASAKLESPASYIEDIENQIVAPYQKRPEIKFNIIPVGKVYSPDGRLVIVYITDKITREELEKMSWGIIRIGCKECLVSVEDVEIGEAKKVSGIMKTCYYFPANVKVIEGRDIIQYADFWDEDVYIWDRKPKLVRYALPLLSYPIKSKEVKVKANEAYEVGGEYVVFA